MLSFVLNGNGRELQAQGRDYAGDGVVEALSPGLLDGCINCQDLPPGGGFPLGEKFPAASRAASMRRAASARCRMR